MSAPKWTRSATRATAVDSQEEIVFPLELSSAEYAWRIWHQMRAALRVLEVIANASDEQNALEENTPMRDFFKEEAHYSTTWAVILERLPSYVEEQMAWLRDLNSLIELDELSESDVSEPEIIAFFENAIAFLVVFSTSGEVVDQSWRVKNMQSLRSQYMKHQAYKRERLRQESEETSSQSKSKDQANESYSGPIVNDDGSMQFDFVADFDQNGILYHIATDGGSIDWKNPDLSGRVKAFRSSEGSGSASDFVGRTGVYSCTDYRAAHQFYGVDFGQFRRVYPNAYTLRNGSSHGWAAPRNWSLEGSLDGKKWWTVRRHRSDDSIPTGAGFASFTFKIEKNKQRKARFLRVVQTRPVVVGDRLRGVTLASPRKIQNSEAQKKQTVTKGAEEKKRPTHHALFLSGFEVYGKLVEV